MGERLSGLRAFVLYLLAALCVTWPGVTRLNTALIGRMGGDNYEHVWYLWWLAQALFEQIGSPIHIPLLNHPVGVYSPLNLTHTPALFLPAVLGRITTPVTAYNIAMIIGPALNALGMYWLAIELTGSRRAALLGGLLFGFSPHLLGHIQAGHLSQITMLGFPLFALFLLRLLRKPTLRRIAATGLSAFIAASHPSHLAYFILPLTCILLGNARGRLRERRMLAALVAAAVLAVALLTPFYLPLFMSRTAITTRTLELGDSVGKSIDLASFVTPPPDNPLLPQAISPLARRVMTNSDESHGYLGWVSLVLVLLGVATQWRTISHWITLAGGALLLSLGPLLKFSGELPTLRIDGTAQAIQLPYALLVQLPLFSWSRTPARFGATVHFAIAILATYGLVAVLKKVHHPRWSAVLISALCLAAFAERIITWPFPSTPAWQTTTLQTLAAPTSGRAILNIPHSFTTNNLALYGQTVHERPILGGSIFRGDRTDEQNIEFLDALLRPPPPNDIIAQPDNATRAAILASYDVDVIVLQHWAETFAAHQRDFLVTLFGDPTATSKLDSLFPLEENYNGLPALTLALNPSDWDAPELWGHSHARYFSGTARLYLYSAHSQTGHLRFSTIPGLRPHRIEITINDQPITTVIVADVATYATPPITLPRGLSVLTLTDLDGPETIWGDLRCAGTTPLAGKLPGHSDCNHHQRGKRHLSAALHNIVWMQAEEPMPPPTHFGDIIELTEVLLPTASDGIELVLPLTFRSLAPINADLTLFVHVFGPLDASSEDAPQLLSQWDSWPLRGYFATSDWNTGEQLGFRVTVPLPDHSPTGEYRVEMGWYDSVSGARLSIATTTRDTHDNVLVVGSFMLSKN